MSYIPDHYTLLDFGILSTPCDLYKSHSSDHLKQNNQPTTPFHIYKICQH
jgi:hypothetical protein